MQWCDTTIEKVLNNSIDVESLLEGVLIPKEIYEIPSVKAYRIDWPIDLDLCNENTVYVSNDYYDISIYNTAIRLIEEQDDDNIAFLVEADEFKEIIKLSLDKDGYHFKHHDGDRLNICIKKKKCSLIQFFEEYPPRIKFVDQSTLEGNYYVTLKNKHSMHFVDSNIQRWNWDNMEVDISVESQGTDKKKNSIQYGVIKKLMEEQQYDIIFDDDNSGEIADIITIKILDDSIDFEFYHCKYSKEKKPGSRVNDLYEVCGQAEKSVEWKQDVIKIIDRMIYRENGRIRKEKASRFEVGDFELLGEIKNRLKAYPANLKIFIVQPGVDGEKITEDMHQVLMASKIYLNETYGIDLGLICS